MLNILDEDIVVKIANHLWALNLLGVALILTSLIFYLGIVPLSKSKLFRSWSQPKRIKLLLWGLFIFGFLLYSALELSLYYALGSPMRDVGIFSQAIWHLSRFEAPASTLRGLSNLWGDHFHPIITLITPLYWLKSDVRWLFIVQAAVVSAGVFPIFAIARDRLKSNFSGFAFAFSWLFFIGVQQAIRFGFYPETLAITFLAFAIYFLFQKRIWPYFLFIILALGCKENISLHVLFLGIWTLIFTKERWMGIITILLGLAWFEVIVGFLIPHLANGPYYYFRYQELGNTPLGALKTIILHPIYTLKIAFGPGKVDTWLYYFVPFGLLPIFATFLLVLIPVMAEKFLSTDPKFWSIGYEYGASATTFLACSAILGAANILNLNFIKKIRLPENLKAAYIGLFLVILTIIFSFKNPTDPMSRLFDRNFWRFHFPADYEQAIQLIPADKSLTAQMTLGTALANRQEIYWWSDYPEQKRGDYLLLSCDYATFPYTRVEHLQRIRDVLSAGDYGVKYSQGDILLLERGLKSGEALSLEIKNCLKGD